jgi:hypothetical protein
MRCDDIRDQLMDLSAADLTSAEPRAREHLETCERCREELVRATRTWTLLTAIPDEEPDSAAMRQQFAGVLRSFRDTSAGGPISSRWWAPVAWRPFGIAAAVLMALLAGTFIGRQLAASRAGEERAIGDIRQQLHDVREMLTLSLLQHGVASNRLKGASVAAQLDDPRDDVLAALIDVLLHDPNVNVRLACVRALGAFQSRPGIRDGVARALSSEPSPLVAMALISYVVEARDPAAIDVLRQVSLDMERDAAVREVAAQGVERLLGGGRL